MARLLVLLSIALFAGAQAQTCRNPTPQVVGECPRTPVVFIKIGDKCCHPDDYICVDKINPKTGVSDCPNMASYCRNSDYLTLMKDQCPKTCGYCNPPTPPAGSTCVDKVNPQTLISDCPQRAAYCRNSGYLDLMRDQCPKTCGYCT